jgi:agmatine/peptidylarginine deiminase
MYAKLVGPDTMVVAETSHPAQRPMLAAAARRFEELGYNVLRVSNVAVPPLDAESTSWGPTLSYANALVVNGTAYVPQYDSEMNREIYGDQVIQHDRQALELYGSAGLKAVGVATAALIPMQGSAHCMTNTLPVGVDPERLATPTAATVP